MWNLLQTSLAAIVGACIYIKPPLQASESPHYFDAFEGAIKMPLVPEVWLLPSPRVGRYRWQTSDQTSQNGPVTPKSNHFLRLLLSFHNFLAARTPSVTCGKLPRGPWFPLKRQKQEDESHRFPWPSFWKTWGFHSLWRPPPFCLPSPLPSARRFRGFCLSASPFSSLHLHSICQRANASVEPAFVWSWLYISHTWTA